MLIRRGKRVADYLHADCFAVAISQEIDLHDMPARDRESVEHHLNFARNLHIETRVLQGQDVAKTLVEFAHLNERHASVPGTAATRANGRLYRAEAWCSKWYTWRATCK